VPDPLKTLKDKERKNLDSGSPRFHQPMLATLTHGRFSDAQWIFERKLDGERCLAVCRNGEVSLYSRNEKLLNDTYPELAEALQARSADNFVVDGEIVAFEGRLTSFSALQPRMQIKDAAKARQTAPRVYYYIFDALHCGNQNLMRLPLTARKKVLKALFDFTDPLRFTSHRNRDGEDYYTEACRKGWEGLIAKQKQSAYVCSRSKKWLKFKCVLRQEFVIGGFTDPAGSRIGIGALLIGYYEKGCLVFAGKVGTGFDDQTLESLRRKLDRMERKTSPFKSDTAPAGDNIHWVTPKLVSEIGFTEWTRGGKLRHPRFQGLRRDKAPEKVVREDKETSP
jgi:DNA ligase D-like protein (predicted ligase)